MTDLDEYKSFIRNKKIQHESVGISIDKSELNDALFPFQKDVVAWCLAKGRACSALNTGLGKTITSLEWAKHTGRRTIILAPLGVTKQTEREAIKFGYDARCRNSEEETGNEQIVITNYEKLHRFNAGNYGAVVVDEASIMKSFTGAIRNEIMEKFAKTPYKLPATATPSPNDYMELGNLSEFVGAMSRSEMLAMFFTHDGGNTSQWRLKGHCEDKFWEWVSTWMVAVQMPSDLGYDNGKYELPALHIVDHPVECYTETENSLFASEAITLNDQRKSKRQSLSARVSALADVVANDPNEQWLIWCELNDEGDALEKAIPGSVQIAGADTDEFKERAMMDFIDGHTRYIICKPSMFGFGLNLQNCARQAFVGVSHSFEQTYQAIRRSWRFGQNREVYVHQFYAEQESAILRNLKRKQDSAQHQINSMVELIQSANGMRVASSKNIYKSNTTMEVPTWLRAL